MGFSEIIRYIGWMVVVVLVLACAAILGYWAPWYFAWGVGTAMTILFAIAAGILYDRQALEYGKDTHDVES